MKTIRIFLASSDELDYDRMAFGNLVRRLDDVYEKRGLRIKLFEWEDYDAAFNDRRKQDEYNDYVRGSDVFLALFYKKAGKFTVEEFDIASEQFREKASPKVYAYIRDLGEGESASPELEEFKRRLFDEMGHYWCRYDSRESLQFQFVMQLQLVESSLSDSVTVEEGDVRIDGMKVAAMDRLPFVAGNEEYERMSGELASLPPKIEKARLRLEKFPDDEDLADDLQQKLNRYNQLKEELDEYQRLLFNTARRVAQLQGQRVTGRMRRAMDAFSAGKVREANIILDEAEADARRNLEDFRQSREITELRRQAVIASIEELLLKTSTVMADAGIPVEERVDRVGRLYAQADEMARETGYDRAGHAAMLQAYGLFLNRSAHYEKALACFEEALSIREQVLGENHPDTARTCNMIGTVYKRLGDYPKALAFYERALRIKVEVLGENHPSTAISCNDIGNVYKNLGDFSKALAYYERSLRIKEAVLEENDPSIAGSYNNIGLVYYDLGEYEKALDYLERSLKVKLAVLGENHFSTAVTYNNLGNVLKALGDCAKAKVYYQKALQIKVLVKGRTHPSTELTRKKLEEIP